MSRYGIFYGTGNSDAYTTLGYTDGLLQFLRDLGAQNPSYTIDTVSQLSGIFSELPGYRELPSGYPVSLRYIPMHLNKRTDMPKTMKPLYVISAKGYEHTKRNAIYSCLALMDREELDGASGLNCLDLIFGTPLVKWTHMKAVREGRAVDYRMPPKKVTHLGDSPDDKAVLSAVAAIYAEKRVVLKLEEGADFNLRSRELLTKIYSLMPPQLAAEVGFATYVSAGEIKELVDATGIRIFVLPHEADAGTLGEDFLLLDCTQLTVPDWENSKDVLAYLKKWNALPLEERTDALSKLFKNIGSGFKDSGEYVRISRDFFDGDFFAWCKQGKSIPQAGTVRTLAELKDIYDSFPETAHETLHIRARFAAMTGILLRSERTLRDITDTAYRDAASCINGKGKVEVPNTTGVFALARFGASLMNQEEAAQMYEGAVLKASHRTLKSAKEAAKNELEVVKADFDRLIADLKAEHASKLQQLAAAHEAEKQQLTAKHDEAYQTLQREVGLRIQQISDLTVQHEQQVAELERRHHAEKDQLAADFRAKETDLAAAHTAECQTLRREIESRVQQITDLKTQHEQDLAALGQQHEEDLQQLYADYKTKVTQLHTEYAQQIDGLKAEKAAVENALAKTSAEVESLRTELDTCTAENHDLQERLTKAKAVYESQNTEIKTLSEDLSAKIVRLQEQERIDAELTRENIDLRTRIESLNDKIQRLSNGSELSSLLEKNDLLLREKQEVGQTLEEKQRRWKLHRIVLSAGGFLAGALIAVIICLIVFSASRKEEIPSEETTPPLTDSVDQITDTPVSSDMEASSNASSNSEVSENETP